MKDVKVLVMEPPNQLLPADTARPNGALGPAYLVGALRQRGVRADYLDATVGWPADSIETTFYNRVEQDNGTVRCGMSPERLAEIFAQYDVIATSSLFTAQTRMHFEAAAIAKRVSEKGGRRILVIAGGVNARALHERFLANHFDVVALGEGEQTIVEIIEQWRLPNPDFSQVGGIAFRRDGHTVVRPVANRDAKRYIDDLPFAALEALPLAVYRGLGIPHAGVLPQGTTFAPIQTSRGCQDQCTFCHISVEKLHPELLGKIGFLRQFSNERIKQDVDRAVALGVTRLYFEDDNMFFNKQRLIGLVPFLKRDGLEYANVNGANLRFLFKKNPVTNSYVVDTEFIEALTSFGLREMVMPFESRNPQMMKEHASGKYDPDAMDSLALVRALKKAGLRIQGNFMIGFRDEPWESVLRTKEFARQLLAEGLNAVGFMIPVPYPGSLDFELVMRDTGLKADFDRDPLKYTDRMHWRAKPLFPTMVPGERLEAAAREFWLELNQPNYVAGKMELNVSTTTLPS